MTKESEPTALLEVLPTIVWRATADGQWIYCNHRLSKLTGADREELCGEGWLSFVHPEDRGELQRAWKAALAERRRLRREIRLRHWDGRHAWYVLKATPAEHEGESCWLGVLTDIEETKRSLANTDRARQRLVAALEGGEVGVWELDLATGMVRTSQQHAEIFGYESPQADWSYGRFLEHVIPEDREQLVSEFQAVIDAKVPWDHVCRVQRADGHVRWIWTRGRVQCDEKGSPTRVLGVVQDITDRQNAQLALHQADRRKNDFLAVLGHELRNPLAVLSTAVRCLEAEGKALSDDPRVMDAINRQLEQLCRLVDDLLDVSRLSRGKIELKPCHLDVGEVVRVAVHAVEETARRRDQQLWVNVPSGHLYIDADESRIRQVCENLLTNAIRYTPPGGTIWFSAHQESGAAVLRCRDNGIGMTDEKCARVFEPFTQLHVDQEQSKSGLGIGLSLVKSIVEAHGGEVAAHSDGPDSGSEFVVKLPVADQQQPVERHVSGVEDLARKFTRLRIVVADDNEDLVFALQALLETRGHEVTTVSDGESAIHVGLEQKPDVMLVDVGLPGRDGYEVVEQLAPTGVRCIGISGYPEAEARPGAKFEAYLLKPIDFHGLVDLIEHRDATSWSNSAGSRSAG